MDESEDECDEDEDEEDEEEEEWEEDEESLSESSSSELASEPVDVEAQAIVRCPLCGSAISARDSAASLSHAVGKERIPLLPDFPINKWRATSILSNPATSDQRSDRVLRFPRLTCDSLLPLHTTADGMLFRKGARKFIQT